MHNHLLIAKMVLDGTSPQSLMSFSMLLNTLAHFPLIHYIYVIQSHVGIHSPCANMEKALLSALFYPSLLFWDVLNSRLICLIFFPFDKQILVF